MSAHYVQFPLFLVPGLFDNKVDTIDKMLCFGIYRYSQRLDGKADSTGLFLLKEIRENCLGAKLHKSISNLIGPPQSVHLMELIGAFNSNAPFKELATDYYRVKRVLEILAMEGNTELIIETAKKVEKLVPEKEPIPMLKVDLLFAFRNAEKTEFEIAQLAAYTAVKSILGVKQYVKTNKRLVLCRMFGYSKSFPKEHRATPLQQKYTKRYHIDRVLEQLQLNWKVKIYSNHIRGFYVTTGSKMSLNELVLKAESTKMKTKLAILKGKKATAFNAAQQQLLHNNATT